MRRKTIYDVAAEAGVSISTVSRVVNNSGYVSKATRKRVIDACKDFCDIPDDDAGREKKTTTIGVIINHEPDYFFMNAIYTNVLLAISIVAKKRGAHLLLEINEDSKDVFDLYKDKDVDGMILMGAKRSSGIVEQMASDNIPFVLIGNYHGSNKNICCVDINDRSAVYNVVNYLIGLGHTRIGIITGSQEYASCADRLAGYCDALKEANIEINNNYIQICDHLNEMKAENLTKQMLYQKDRITALVAFNDNIALAAYKAAKDCGLEIPTDLSVVGFDDTQIASYLVPPLTSVWQPSREKGERAMNLLLDAIDNKTVPNERVELNCITMHRDSCSNPRE